MSKPNATGTAAGAASDDGNGALPALDTVRPRATTGDGDPAVEIRFENGAMIRYRAAGDGIEEEWFAPEAGAATHSHAADLPNADGGSNRSENGAPTRSDLSDRALCTVASYLSFGDRRRAAFSWGKANVAVLLGEEPQSNGG